MTRAWCTASFPRGKCPLDAHEYYFSTSRRCDEALGDATLSGTEQPWNRCRGGRQARRRWPATKFVRDGSSVQRFSGLIAPRGRGFHRAGRRRANGRVAGSSNARRCCSRRIDLDARIARHANAQRGHDRPRLDPPVLVNSSASRREHNRARHHFRERGPSGFSAAGRGAVASASVAWASPGSGLAVPALPDGCSGRGAAFVEAFGAAVRSAFLEVEDLTIIEVERPGEYTLRTWHPQATSLATTRRRLPAGPARRCPGEA